MAHTAYKWYISPSSQDGNGWGDYLEEVYCNEIADILIPILERHGQICKRNDPKNIYSDHRKESNLWGADYHLPIHTNASGSHNARGMSVRCANPADKTKASTIFAQHVYDELAKVVPNPRGLVQDNFDEIVNTNAPCAYLEILFHDQTDDQKFLLENKEKIAIAIAKGCLNTVGIVYDRVDEIRPMYRVQIGAFRNREYADAFLAKVNKVLAEENARQGKVIFPTAYIPKPTME